MLALYKPSCFCGRTLEIGLRRLRAEPTRIRNAGAFQLDTVKPRVGQYDLAPSNVQKRYRTKCHIYHRTPTDNGCGLAILEQSAGPRLGAKTLRASF